MIRFVQKEAAHIIPEQLRELDVHPRLLSLLVNRGINTKERIHRYLHPKASDLYDPMLMQDMDKAVSVICDAIEKHERITIFGDYDVDGVTATAILHTYLRKQGAQVDYYIPDRHGEGYGLNTSAIEKIAKNHTKLLITVDCGITCPNEVEMAQRLGMRVIVTDHHQLGPQIPRCEAVLNPLLGQYPFRQLCGAGVAFKLVQALGGNEAISQLWELAALATIADIVPLLDENRVIVTCGLQKIVQSKRPGLVALMESAGVDQTKVTASDIAFRIAPRINAGGRLASASRGVELLTTRHIDIAREIAEELNLDNTKRREIENEIFAQADEVVQRDFDFLSERAIVVCGEGWNPGVIGLVASRLVEKYRWPAILLTQNEGVCVGSARSIPGVDIHQAMATCRDLFIRFGGHAQAAGLTIEAQNLPEFRERLTCAIRNETEQNVFIPTEEYDLELDVSDITEELVQAFDAMQPTGFGNPAPVFYVSGVHTTDIRAIGKDQSHLRMNLSAEGEMRSAIGFRMGNMAKCVPEIIDALVSLSINVWQDKKSVQCELKKIRPYAPSKAFLTQCLAQQSEIDASLLDGLSLNQAEADTCKIEHLSLEAAKKRLAEPLSGNCQGVLLVVHTTSALKMLNIHLALIQAQLDYEIHTVKDIRQFNSLIMAPDWKNINSKARLVVVLDGFLNPAEQALAIQAHPDTPIIEVTDMRIHTKNACSRLLIDDEKLRFLYQILRKEAYGQNSSETIADKAGLSMGQLECALRIFSELGLVSYTRSPFSLQLEKSGKVSLSDSSLRSQLMDIKGDTRGALF